MSWLASTRLAASFRGRPVISPSSATASSAYPGSAQMPVPMAVPPRLISRKRRGVLVEPVHLLAEGDGVGLELLAEGHGDGVLELGPAHLDDPGELLALGPERRDELFQDRDELPHAVDERDAEGGRVYVVGRLRQVDVVVGVTVGVIALGEAHELEGAVGDDLVGVHVRRGSGPALDHVHHEVRVPLAVDDLSAGPDDGGGDVGREEAERPVGPGGGHLDLGQGDDEIGEVADIHAADGEVLRGPERLDAVVELERHLPLPEEVVLGPCSAGDVLRRRIHDLVRRLAHPPGDDPGDSG